jgi:hypothetical protein
MAIVPCASIPTEKNASLATRPQAKSFFRFVDVGGSVEHIYVVIAVTAVPKVDQFYRIFAAKPAGGSLQDVR